MEGQNVTQEQYDELKKSLNSEQLAILEQAEKDCADLSLSYFDVNERSYQWKVGKYFDRKTFAHYATLQDLLCEVLRRAGELRGTKFSE